MKKIVYQQDKVLAIIIFLMTLLFVAISPIAKGYANQIEYTEVQERKNDLDTYTSSNDLFSRVNRTSLRIYIDYLQKQGIIKEMNAENVSEALLSNAKDLTENDKALFFENVISVNDSSLYNNMNYYLSDKDGNVFSNSQTLMQIQKSKDQNYGGLMADSWLYGFSFDKDGNQETTISNISYPATMDYEETSFQEYALNEIDSFFMENNDTNRLEWKPITNMTFILEIPMSDFISNKIEVYDDYTSYIQSDTYRYVFLKEYAGLAVLMGLLALLLPLKKMQESRIVRYLTGNITSFLMLIAQGLAFILAASVGHSVFIRIGINTPITTILMLPILFVLFLPPAFIGLSVKKYYAKYNNKEYKEETALYTNILHAGLNVRNMLEKHTRIRFDNHDLNRTISITIMNALALLMIGFVYLLTGMQDFGVYIMLLLLYSLGVYFILRHAMRRIGKDYQSLNEEIRRMAHGEIKEGIQQDLGIFEPMKDSLQDLQEDFKEAVEQEVQSQRMKTELITNVSHDLKTPLTSIISYIDLLKDASLSEEEQQKYILILESSSNRLKHLIENLFEISKANSGNVDLNFMDVDIISLLKQAEVECEAHLKKQNLILKNQFADDKVMIRLDSQKTYRIFENLLSNVGKYALSHTRVYVRVEDYGHMVEVSIKNISSQELDFDPDEIMERFTRGDKSRNTEGSGLGLAIAKSFTELQHGIMKISIDGDLFKVSVRFYRDFEEEPSSM